MKAFVKDLGFLLTISLLSLLPVIGIVSWIESERCAQQWAHSGLKSSWGLFSGCLLELEDGTLIPASVYRKIEER